MPNTLDNRFWAKVNKNGPTQPHMDTCCWEWIGARTGDNKYGKISIDGKLQRAHRVGWLLQTGEEPIYIRHKCDNSLCVKASHLINTLDKSLGQSLNTIEAHSRGLIRYNNGAAMNTAKLSEYDVVEIRFRYFFREKPSSIVKDFPVSQGQISHITARRNWRHT